MHLEEFEIFLRESYRAGTVYEYMWRVRDFLRWLGNRQLDQGSIIEYMKHLKERGVRQLSTYAYAIRCYLEFLGRKDLAGKVPVQRGFVQKIPLWLPEPAIKVLIAHLKGRDRALVATIYDLALRVREAVMLDLGPLQPNRPFVDLERGVANVFRTKTRQYPWSVLPMSSWLVSILKSYTREYGIRRGEPLFQSYKAAEGAKGGGRMSRTEAEHIWRRIRDGLNFPKEFTLHNFRHSKLTWMAVIGMTVIEIAKFAGHSSTSPTLTYTHLAEQFMSKPEIILEPFKESLLYYDMLEAVERWRMGRG